MGNVLVKEETLTEIADSIREKNGSSDKYKPAEIPEAIRNISTSSDDGPSLADPIRFFNSEGELLYSYTLEEAAEMTTLPPLPALEGMTCQGWNWSLEDIQNEGKEVDVGAIFITDDGATRIYVDLTENILDVYLGFGQAEANTVWVDWGDGSELEQSEVYGRLKPVNMFHHYEKAGQYILRLLPEENAQISFLGDDIDGSFLLRQDLEKRVYNSAHAAALTKVELGSNISRLEEYAFAHSFLRSINIPNGVQMADPFYNCSFLETLILPDGVKDVGGGLCQYCYRLKRVVLPNGLTNLDDSMFNKCYSLEELIIPDSVLTLYGNALSYCSSLRRVIMSRNVQKIRGMVFRECVNLSEMMLPDTVTEIGTYAFQGCSNLERVRLPEGITELSDYVLKSCGKLKKIEIPPNVTKIGNTALYSLHLVEEITIPAGVTEINSGAFSYNYSVKNYYILPQTPPTLLYAAPFNNIAPDCKMHVPKGCLEAYQTATYWSAYADYMVEMEE